MVRIHDKAFGLFVPPLTDVLIGGKPSERFEPLGEVISHQEGREVLFEVLMGLVIVFFDRGFLQGSIHALHLAIGPGMVGFGETVLDAIVLADAIEKMVEGILIAFAVSELHAVIGQHRVDFVGYGGNHVA
jgi:hypothetical protein